MDEQRNPLKSELKFLERLSMEELEALLELSGDPDDVELLFDTVVEEVVAREKEHPTGRLPDVDTAWDELQMMYHNMPDEGRLPPSSVEVTVSAGEDGLPLANSKAAKPRRIPLRRVARTAAVMAAAVALCLALMVGAQAAGVDVFGALAQWTDETFHFETWSAEPGYCEALHDTIQEVLDTQGISGAFVPTWYPEGTSIIDVQVFEDDLGICIQVSLSDDIGNRFFVGVDQYRQGIYVNPQTFEVKADSVEKYTSNGQTYYIFANAESIMATWSDGTVLQRIWGKLTIDDIKAMIDSIER